METQQARRIPWAPEASSDSFHRATARPETGVALTMLDEKFEGIDEDGIRDADLPILPAEQYTSVWEAIIAHL
jgi:hypothetical protein